MKKIEAYKLSDGSLETDKETAIKKEKNLILKRDIEKFVEQHVAYQSNKDVVNSALLNNFDEIKEVFFNYFKVNISI